MFVITDQKKPRLYRNKFHENMQGFLKNDACTQNITATNFGY